MLPAPAIGAVGFQTQGKSCFTKGWDLDFGKLQVAALLRQLVMGGGYFCWVDNRVGFQESPFFYSDPVK